jgi:hypothetical protein
VDPRVAHRLLVLLIAGSSTAAAIAACSEGLPAQPEPESFEGGPDTPSCPDETPPSCPSPPPSWKNDIQPIIMSRCFPCHVEGGIAGSKFVYTTYQGVFKNRADILDKIGRCVMPPPDAAAPTSYERYTLLGWIECTAPNN